MRESQVEKYLVERVEANGGLCEKFTSPGRRNVPDRLVSWPATCCHLPEVAFVECKATGKKPTPAQRRDHKRRREMGHNVYVVDSYEAVDAFIKSEGF